MKERFYQILLITSFLALSWLSFMIVHEFGHVVTAWATGGSVSRLVLHPLKFSLTEYAHNPQPRLVAWGGLIIGTLLPLAFFFAAQAFRWPALYLFRYFAGFCLVANGLYLFVDTFERGGDGGTLQRHGAPSWQLLLFAAVSVPLGLRLWHGLGEHFGLDTAEGKVSHQTAIITTVMLAIVIIIELALY